MKRELLTAVVQARRRKEAVVLVRGLTSGRQFIVTSKELAGDVDGIAPELRDAARAALDLEGARSFATDDERFLLQTLVAPPRIVIIGAVHIAQALIPMASRAGYDIYLIDPRTAFANAERFPDISIDNRWPAPIVSI